MDKRPVTITVTVEHPDLPEGIHAVSTVPANEFGPDVMRHMCEGLYGVLKEQAQRTSSPIILTRKPRLVQ